MNTVFRWLLAISLLLCGKLACAQQALKCAVCDEPLTGEYHLFDSPTLAEKKPICGTCLHLDTVCSICGVPVKTGYQTLDDGRLLCEQDAKVAVLLSSDALRIWDETQRDLVGIYSGFGVLPGNFTVNLVDQTQMVKVYKNQFSWHDKNRTMGLTQTRMKGLKQFDHTVYLLSGLNPARLAAVCAHEYSHAWLHENLSRERQLEANTVEGFCELVAHKLMTQRDEAVERKVILANSYTRGQINTLVQAENGFQFYRLLDWFKNGADDHLDRTNLVRVLKLHEETPPSPLWYPAAPPTPVPDTLTLKGISGNSNRRFALINDRTLEKNEIGKVRVGKTNIVVRCLEISDRSVVLQPRDSAERIKLSLRE